MAKERKTRNSTATKAKILAAAETEFAQKGLAGARVDNIARISGFNKNMIYQYYQSKEKLYETVIYNEYSKLSELENVIMEKDFDYKEKIETIVREYFLFLKSNPNFVRLIMWENLNEAKYIEASGALNIKDPMLKMLKNTDEKGKNEKIFNKSADEKQVLISLITGAFSYFSNMYTLSKVIHIDLENDNTMNERIKIVTDSVLNYLMKGN
mgnify:CR=1 FL=1